MFKVNIKYAASMWEACLKLKIIDYYNRFVATTINT